MQVTPPDKTFETGGVVCTKSEHWDKRDFKLQPHYPRSVVSLAMFCIVLYLQAIYRPSVNLHFQVKSVFFSNFSEKVIDKSFGLKLSWEEILHLPSVSYRGLKQPLILTQSPIKSKNNISATSAEWQGWGHWSQCTTSCGDGSRVRGRGCLSDPAFGGSQQCHGNSTQIEECKTSECPGNPLCIN